MRSGKSWRNVPSDKMENIRAYETFDSRSGPGNSTSEYARQGDVIRLDYLPGRGTTVTINNESRGSIEGEDFMRAWLRIWLGAHPADSGLKKGLLGS